MNEPVCLGFSMSEIANVRILLWLCETEISRKINIMLSLDSFIVNIKTEGIYVDITKDVETRFDIINYELERPLPRAKK